MAAADSSHVYMSKVSNPPRVRDSHGPPTLPQYHHHHHPAMSRARCTLTKAKISWQLADCAREALERDYEPRLVYEEPAPVRILNRRPTSSHRGEEPPKPDDAVEEVKRRFEEEFNSSDRTNGECRTPLIWGKPAIFQYYPRREIRHTSPGTYHGLVALSDNCDLPGGQGECGKIGQGYYWDAETPVMWECKGGGYCISFAFARN